MRKRIALLLCIVLALCTLLTGCKKEVAVDFSGLNHMTTDGAAVTMTTEEYSATSIADTYFVLPETVTVSVDGTVLTDGYTYDPATGVLTIAGDSVTGDIAVEAAAVETIVGSWRGTFDMTDALNAYLAMSEIGEMFQLKDFVIVMNVDFNEDGTYHMYMDETSGAEAVDSLLMQMEEFLLSLIEDVLAEEGLNLSVDEFLKMSGISMDLLVQEAVGENLLESFLASCDQSGNYVAEDGKIHASLDEALDPDMYYFETYTIEDGRLTLDAGNGKVRGDMQNIVSMLYPLVYERVTE